MLLRNLEILGSDIISDIHVQNGKIAAMSNNIAAHAGAAEINLDGAIAFPGIINSHDHLDFDLFPQLGNRHYNNYVEWGEDIHSNNKAAINAVLKIPKPLRVKWGIYRNLVNGVTTVVHHGEQLKVSNDIITVFQECYSLHSIQLEKRWKYKLNTPFRKGPFVVHIGEGNDVGCHKEIDELIKWNIIRRDIVGIHGIAMNKDQAARFKALVWCPDSNVFLFGSTAPLDTLKRVTTILFGTDSTVSASWNIWDQLRLAKSQSMVSDQELQDMLTISAASIWGLNSVGSLKPGYHADIVIARQKKGAHGFDAYYALNPEDILLVIHRGAIKLFDEALLGQIDSESVSFDKLSRIVINGAVKYVYGDMPALMKEIKHYNNEVIFPFESYPA